MSRGFVTLATGAVDDFARLVWQLITDSGNMVANILETEFQRSMAQMNDTQFQFLQTTMDLMAQARNTTAQAQRLVATLLVSFGGFMQGVILDFKAVGTDYTSRLRSESASRTQASFSNLLQDRIFSLQRQARLYEWGVLNLSRYKDQPLDDGTCTLLGLLCTASREVQRNVYLGTARGNMVFCDVTDIAYSLMVAHGPGADTVIMPNWPPYVDNDPNANLTQFKAACLAGSQTNVMNVTCARGTGMDYPTYCNGTCAYDPRCRPWYKVHYGASVPRTQMSAVYIDIVANVPIVTLSYPIFSLSPRSLVAVVATDFYFSDVDNVLRTLGSGSASQLVAVIFNSSDLIVVGTSRPCPATATGRSSGVPVIQTCDPALRLLGGWLVANTGLQAKASLELNGTLWDVFPSMVDSFSYFVAVGMNKSEVYSVIDATNQAARDTLQALSQQQSAQMAMFEAAALASMDAMSAAKLASIRASQAALAQQQVALHAQTAQTFNASRHKSAADLDLLIRDEMDAIKKLEDYHLSRVVKSVGVTFGAVVGIFVGILLGGTYGTWIVTRQVQRITETMEDVADMKVEQLQVSEKSSISEVQRIETALGVLVQRLAEYKSYMPAGLFLQQQNQEELQAEECPPSPASPSDKDLRKRSLLPPRNLLAPSQQNRKLSSAASDRSGGTRRGTFVRSGPTAGAGTRLLRRNVAVMAVNMTRFQAELAQRNPAQLEATLNKYISTVHRLVAKAQGNIDAVIGDQLLVTFNAHFGCSDPPVAASHVALDVLTALKEELAIPGRVQIGLATGPMSVGHLGYAQFKAMLALGAPMKVASLLAHLSDFESHAVLVCPSVAERIRYQFAVQPVDLLSLPQLGEHVNLYAKPIAVHAVTARAATARGSQEWLYEVNANESSECAGDWKAVFKQLAKAHSLQKARDDLGQYLRDHADDRVAHRLLRRLPRWQPRVGLVLSERPDTSDALPPSPSTFSLSMSVEQL
eukprot:EG_transcript_1527